ncbi:CAP domain-containing protein [Cytophagales bacterium LB-30]|uniref:CAP domain-containing protein n=1 Tax=Shiella aurantiaca TaxID=3058365 RepID=A0ABT8F2T8_9BACT|nr:CAP domain-containing protein [Shiella aurantiaca]MDN4164770.1 CAP domain-containing protein [Shiella aurantiaca]
MIIFLLSLSLWLQPSFSTNDTTVCLSADEKKLYDLLMKYRKEKKLPPISLSASLTQVAQAHVKDLMENYMASDSCNPHSWSDKGDWTACCYTSDHKQAECMWNKPQEIAQFNTHGYEIAFWHSAKATPEEALSGWKKSTGHNQVMINASQWKEISWQAVGVGMYEQYAVIWFAADKDEKEKPRLCQ